MKRIKMFNIYDEEEQVHEVADHITSDSHVILWDGFFGKWTTSERRGFHEKTIQRIREAQNAIA